VTGDERRRLRPRDEDPFGDGLDELPPNVPPGFLGERGPDLRKADSDGSHGTNAGIIQEWTLETTMMAVILSYILFFPLAFVILWRSRKVSRSQKIVSTIAMTAGLAYFGWRFFTG
jgi:hypothetical protein